MSKSELVVAIKLLNRLSVEDKINFRDYLLSLKNSEEREEGAIL